MFEAKLKKPWIFGGLKIHGFYNGGSVRISVFYRIPGINPPD